MQGKIPLPHGLDRLNFILGAPRSGTTWLAKIFDSHPDVLYRHEPDLAVSDLGVPSICRMPEVGSHLARMRQFVAQQVDIATLTTAGSLPVFRKRHEWRAIHLARSALVQGLRVALRVAAPAQRRRFPVPSAVDWDRHPPAAVVMKSVSSLGRAGLLAEAVPEARIILMLRHPFGQIASRAYGVSHGKFRDHRPLKELCDTDEARSFGLTEAHLASLSPIEQWAWEWVILNEKAHGELADRPNVTVLRYMDLVSAPVERSRELFGFVGLDWDPAVDRFIEASTSFRGPDLYYHVHRSGDAPMHKWRDVLQPADQERIGAIVARSSILRFWPDLVNLAPQASGAERGTWVGAF
jgi:hypothetical protein